MTTRKDSCGSGGIFKDLDLVEQLGSGIPRILQFYEKNAFQFSENFLRIVLPSNGIENGGQDGGQVNSDVKGLTKAQYQVFRLVLANPKISRRELAEKLHINESAIQKHITALKDKKIMERVGKTTGFWKIKKE